MIALPMIERPRLSELLGTEIPATAARRADALAEILRLVVAQLQAPEPWPDAVMLLGPELAYMRGLAYHAGLVDAPPDDDVQDRIFAERLVARP